MDFAPIPRSEFGSRYSWQSFPMESFCVVSMTLLFTLHLTSSIPLGDLWRARQRIDIPPSILYFSVSLCPPPPPISPWNLQIFYSCNPCNMSCKVHSFYAVNVLKVKNLLVEGSVEIQNNEESRISDLFQHWFVWENSDGNFLATDFPRRFLHTSSFLLFYSLFR